MTNGEWCLTMVELAYNHRLLMPHKSRYLRCIQIIYSIVKWKLEVNDIVEIRMNKSFLSLVVEAGCLDNLKFMKKVCRNFIDKARHLRLGKWDAEVLLKYFDRIYDMDDGFYASMDMNNESRSINILYGLMHRVKHRTYTLDMS